MKRLLNTFSSFSLSKHAGVIIAGGKGQQIISADIPKSLILVMGMPLIHYAIERLKEMNISEIFVVVDHASKDEVGAVIRRLVHDNHSTPKIVLIGHKSGEFTFDVLHMVAKRVAKDCIVTPCDLIFDRLSLFCLL